MDGLWLNVVVVVLYYYINKISLYVLQDALPPGGRLLQGLFKPFWTLLMCALREGRGWTRMETRSFATTERASSLSLSQRLSETLSRGR